MSIKLFKAKTKKKKKTLKVLDSVRRKSLGAVKAFQNFLKDDMMIL